MACLTTGVSASAVTGLMIKVFMPCASRLSTSATCLDAVFSPFVIIRATSDRLDSAYLRLPSTMLTRQELSIVPCEKPILILSSACAMAIPDAAKAAAAAKMSFLLICGRVISTSQECPARRYCRAVAQSSARSRGISLSPCHFEENRSDDDGAFHNLLRERRNTEEIEYVGKNRDDRSPQYGSTHPAFTAKQAGAANDGDGNCLKFQSHASDRLANCET